MSRSQVIEPGAGPGHGRPGAGAGCPAAGGGPAGPGLAAAAASVHYLPVDTALKRYFKTGELPVAQLEALRRQAEESIRRYPHYRYHDGLSLVNYLVGAEPGNRALAGAAGAVPLHDRGAGSGAAARRPCRAAGCASPGPARRWVSRGRRSPGRCGCRYLPGG